MRALRYGALALTMCAGVAAQPRLFLAEQDFVRIEALARRAPWAAAVRDGIVQGAAGFPQSHLSKYGLAELKLPDAPGQWTHHYVCPTHGVRLVYSPPMTHRCPVDNRTYSGWPYDEVIADRQHDDLANMARDLALAYRFTGKQEYAERAAWILKQYAERYLGYELHDKDGKVTRTAARVHAQTLDEAVWLIPMAWAYDLLAGSGALSAEERAAVETKLLRAAVETIERYDAGISNWQSWHNAAIAAVGFALGDARLIEAAIAGKSGLLFQLERSVVGEGFWYEGAWSYHFYALDALVQTAEMAYRNGVDVYAHPTLLSLFTTPLRLAFPDLTLPAFNDSPAVNLVSYDRLYEMAYGRYGDARLATLLGRRARSRNALFWGAETVEGAAPAAAESEIFPDSGFAVLRSPKSDHTVAMKFGPHGGGHGHYDKLNLISFGLGGILALDPGTQPYAAPTHNTWDKMTVAHNTVVVDERRQEEAKGALRWHAFTDEFAAVSAEAGPAYRNASLTRTLFHTGDYLLDVFEVEAPDNQPHTFDWLWHNEGVVETDLALTPYTGFGRANGYQHLTQNRGAQTDGAWRLAFDGMLRRDVSYGSVWASAPEVAGTFAVSPERARSGQSSAKASYRFRGAGYLLFTTPLTGQPESAPAALSLWVFGDGSKHRLGLRINDASDERFVTAIGAVDWEGWRQIEVREPEKWTHYLGNNDGVVDAPIRSVTLELTRVAEGPGEGALCADDLTIEYADGSRHEIGYEWPSRSVRLWMLGGEATTVVTGNGLGPDLTKPVPYVCARRRGARTRYVTLAEPYRVAPAVSGFEETAPGVYVIRTAAWEDHVVIGGDGVAGYRRIGRQ